MKTKLVYFWSILQSSFWFVPLQLILVSIIAATGFIYLDTVWEFEPSGVFKYYMFGEEEAARSILSTIAGAMIGVAGTVFSITLVALTLASSQFGPRLLQNFMHDRINQVVLGSYIATFNYCLLVLRAVKSGEELGFVPNISIIFAIFLAIVNIFLLVIFIHHISVSIQADQVISNVNNNLHKNFKRLFPIKDTNDSEPLTFDEKMLEVKKAQLKQEYSLNSRKSGYLQSIDHHKLMELAKEVQGIVEVKKHAGNFIVEKQELIIIHTSGKLEDGLEDRFRSSFIIGNKRTSSQDAEFAIRQMVEVAARALSPGVNDPFTAITCIDKLTDVICYLTSARLPSPYHFDGEGEMRLVTKTISFDGVMSVAFNQIRQFGSNSPAVIIRLMEAMITIFQFAEDDQHKNIILKHASMISHTGEKSFLDENDVKDLKERYEQLKTLI
ncbi:DUF2254 domain-containing protein [Echinicola sp. CAU 1574]|uniref:DUF2254 domain-containing protein n=1 Tax=Echinicola arenosa TaxID=2774144 RepID=A0ABR9AQE0_9BACT|nr:DUF2254 domain-containing protein [Echinicola arenosa]MBD8490992.1 DUF2254 domain-containing protein [Echinicola arenosa]